MAESEYVFDKTTGVTGWVSRSFIDHPDYEDRFEKRDPECVDCAEPPAQPESARPAGNASREDWAAYVGSLGGSDRFDDDTKRDELIVLAGKLEAEHAAAASDQEGTD